MNNQNSQKIFGDWIIIIIACSSFVEQEVGTGWILTLILVDL
jgi:hypothetical protein